MKWFTADLHFDHESIIHHCRRPFTTVDEMNDCLVEMWNSYVRRGDYVYIVGDFAWRRHLHFIGALKGKKILIKGNHDKMSRECYAQFIAVYDIHHVKIDGIDIVLCHYPFHTWRGYNRGAWHLHGHCHGTLNNQGLYREDVGVDTNNFRLYTWEGIRYKMMRKFS